MVGAEVFFGLFKSELFYDKTKNEYRKDESEFPTPGSYNPPNTHYTQIQCSVKPKNIGQLVGVNGKAFIAITRCARVDYIWINKERNIIEIWGPKKNFDNAKLRLIERMQRIEFLSDQKIENARLKLIERTQLIASN